MASIHLSVKTVRTIEIDENNFKVFNRGMSKKEWQHFEITKKDDEGNITEVRLHRGESQESLTFERFEGQTPIYHIENYLKASNSCSTLIKDW